MFIRLIASVVFASALLCCGFTFAGEVEAMREPANKVGALKSAANEEVGAIRIPAKKIGFEKSTATGKIDSTTNADGTLRPSKTQSKKENSSHSKQNSAKMGVDVYEYKPDTDGTGELKVK